MALNRSFQKGVRTFVIPGVAVMSSGVISLWGESGRARDIQQAGREDFTQDADEVAS